MFEKSKLKEQMLRNFEEGKVECKIESGEHPNLVFSFFKGDDGNTDYMAGLEAVHEQIAEEMKKRGLDVGSYGYGWKLHSGYSVEVSIPARDLEKAKQIQQSFGKELV